jgi:hypothetical protein
LREAAAVSDTRYKIAIAAAAAFAILAAAMFGLNLANLEVDGDELRTYPLCYTSPIGSCEPRVMFVHSSKGRMMVPSKKLGVSREQLGRIYLAALEEAGPDFNEKNRRESLAEFWAKNQIESPYMDAQHAFRGALYSGLMREAPIEISVVTLMDLPKAGWWPATVRLFPGRPVAPTLFWTSIFSAGLAAYLVRRRPSDSSG